MQTYQKNELVETEIVDISNQGYGIGHTEDGRVIFINGAVTGDYVVAKIIKITSSYLVGRLENIQRYSEHRLDHRFCDAPLSCGGCVYRDISYEYELQLKEEYVRNTFRKMGLSEVTVTPVQSTHVTTAYRNKAQYPICMGKDGPQAGFFAAKTHHVIPSSACQLHPPVFSEIVDSICAFAKKNNISVYNEQTQKGLLRHIYIRIGQKTNQIMVCLVINGLQLPHSEQLCRTLTQRFSNIASIQTNRNAANTNVVLGDSFKVLYGQSYIEDELCGLTLQIGPASFYQVNRDAAELLYTIGANQLQLTGNETLLDLYCGIGSIGLSMANNAKKVFGIEIVEEAIQSARNNAIHNQINNAFFACGDATNAMNMLSNVEQTYGALNPDVVILDPPRKGTTPELIHMISTRKIPRVLYISCNCETLARDCQLFKNEGYAIGTIIPVDLFPRTGHVEMVVLLSKVNTPKG